MVSFFNIFYANILASFISGVTFLILSMLANLKAHTDSDDQIRLIQCHILMNGLAIVSLTFLNRLHHVCRSVSPAHSIAIKGVAINDAGAFHNFWYHFHFVNALCMASFMLHAVLQTHSTGSKTQYIDVFVASATVYNHVQNARGATQTVFHSLFHRFFRNHMVFYYI